MMRNRELRVLVAAVVMVGIQSAGTAQAQFTADYQTNIISSVTSNWSGNYVVGSNTVGDVLLVQDAGVLSNGTAVLGFESNSSDNGAVVTGAGSVWNNSGDLYVGYAGAGNSLVISDGGAVINGWGFLGYDFSSSNSSVLVTGTGSVWSCSPICGADGPGNSVVISNGGQVFSSFGMLGGGSGSSNNSVLVTGPSSLWSVGSLWLSAAPGNYGGNSLTISDGGAVETGESMMGWSNNFNRVVVSDAGSIWSNVGTIYLGYRGSGHSLVISNGGQVINHDCFIGYAADASNNSVLVTDPGSVWSNSDALHVGYFQISPSWGGAIGGGNSLVISNGGLVIAENGIEIGHRSDDFSTNYVSIVDGGSLEVAGFTVNPPRHRLFLNGGYLSSRRSNADYYRFFVGDGTNPATFHLSGGLHQFLHGLEIRSNGFLTGRGTITGDVVIDPGGTVLADTGRVLTFAGFLTNGVQVGVVTNNGTMQAINGSELVSYATLVNNGVISGPLRLFASIRTRASPYGSGSISGGGTVEFGSNVTVCATPDACYTFVNWAVDGSVVSTSACYTFVAAKSELLVANFAYNCLTIQTSSSPPGGGITTGGGNVPPSSNVTVCAVRNQCYTFVDWTVNSHEVSTSACYTFPAVSNETVVANFAPLACYAIDTSSSPSGGGQTSGSGTVETGSNVTVCAMPNSCYTFVDWTVNSSEVSTSPCYSFTAVGNESLVANFVPIPYGGSANGRLTTLWSFTNSLDGANSYAALVQGRDANYYGTTSQSGTSGNGTVFQISPSGSLTTLWSFTNGLDGAYPVTGLVQGSDGSFYGTTYGYLSGPSGYGTVFRISSSGSLTTLWSFTNGLDGADPGAGLVQGSDDNFYGTTSGSCWSGPSGYGTVFRISSSGSLTTLWSFTNGVDGAYPLAGLVQGSDGNLYGTTYGSGEGPSGYGTVFRISSSGSLTTLWSFTNGLDGANPCAALVQGSDANLYGTTSGSGSGPNGYGTLFRIGPNGGLTTLWEFASCSGGAHPRAALVQGSDGKLYGTTYGSGAGPSSYGTVFRISPSGSLTTLWSFTNGLDGASSLAGLVQGADGNFFGTTYGSGVGPSAYGTVFKLCVPLDQPPIITSSPTNFTVQCAAEMPAADDSLVTAADNCGGPVTITHDADVISAQTCSNHFKITRIYHVMDSYGNSNSIIQTITVNDTTSPRISCPPDLMVNTDPGRCDASGVVLGSATIADNCGGPVTLVNNAPAQFTTGTNEVVWTGTDDCGSSATCTQHVIVVDNQPPTISRIAVTPAVLWPPTYKLVNVTVRYQVADNCDPSPVCSLSVAGNVPSNGRGDGHNRPDWVVVDAHHVRLRAARAGKGDERIYTITITCTDKNGNVATQTATVTVRPIRPRRLALLD